jgi:hypothetical protein
LRRRTPIRPISDRRREQMAERKRNWHDAYGYRPDCAGRGIIPVCDTRSHPADDGHEVLSRGRGGSITDPGNGVPLCRTGHTWVTEHPAGAEALGMLRPSDR